MSMDPQGIDWTSDEAVVRAAVPDAHLAATRHGKKWIGSGLVSDGMLSGISHSGTNAKRWSDAWHSARQHPNVQAFESAYRSALSTPQRPEPTELELMRSAFVMYVRDRHRRADMTDMEVQEVMQEWLEAAREVADAE